MHLYLSNKNLTREIPDITLHDGYIPVIGNHRPKSDQDDDKPIYIEPAVWFKVLVLDSITIDCVKRKIKWISSDVTGETQQFSKLVGDTKVVLRKPRKRISKMQYIEEEYYDYQSNMDDLFEKSKDVMQALSDLKITAHQFDDTILQLLHCYVLPSIKLTVDDIPEVEAAYETMEHIITEKDNEIVHRNEDVERQKNALKRLRDTLLEELKSGDCVFPQELQDVLLQDIHEDIQQCWKEFVNLQQKVEDSKCQSCRENLNQQAENFEHVLSASEVCTECQSGIEEKRRKRDEHHEHYLSTIQARENLKNMSQSVKKPIKKKLTIRSSFRKLKGEKQQLPNPQHNIYIEHGKELACKKKSMIDLTHKKVLVTSVKEALRIALTDLKNGIETYGIDVGRFGDQRATDVLRQSRVPVEWQTLDQKVSFLLSRNTASPAYQMHKDFCTYIIEQCDLIINKSDTEMLSNLPDHKSMKFLNPLACVLTQGNCSDDEDQYEPVSSSQEPKFEDSDHDHEEGCTKRRSSSKTSEYIFVDPNEVKKEQISEVIKKKKVPTATLR